MKNKIYNYVIDKLVRRFFIQQKKITNLSVFILFSEAPQPFFLFLIFVPFKTEKKFENYLYMYTF